MWHSPSASSERDPWLTLVWQPSSAPSECNPWLSLMWQSPSASSECYPWLSLVQHSPSASSERNPWNSRLSGTSLGKSVPGPLPEYWLSKRYWTNPPSHSEPEQRKLPRPH